MLTDVWPCRRHIEEEDTVVTEDNSSMAFTISNMSLPELQDKLQVCRIERVLMAIVDCGFCI